MTKKERAIQLLERIPEEKMYYILGVLEGAAIPEFSIPEFNMENIASFLGTSDGSDEDMDAFYEALENMARAELKAYKDGDK